MALHPVAIALERVDLAVVGEHAEGLGQLPFGEGVRGIALVEDREGGDETLVLQIRIELVDGLGQEHALVNDVARRQRTDIQLGHRLQTGALLDPATHQIKRTFELIRAPVRRVLEQDLLNRRTGCGGLGAQTGRIDRHLTPAEQAQPGAQDFCLDNGAALFLGPEISPRQEDHAHANGVIAGLVPGARHRRLEEVLSDAQTQTGAVAGLAIRIHRAPVPDRLEGFQTQLDGFPARLALDVGDQADAARRALAFKLIGARIDQTLAFLQVIKLAHSAGSAIGWDCAVFARAIRSAWMVSAASRPSFTAQTTRDAPRTASPPA